MSHFIEATADPDSVEFLESLEASGFDTVVESLPEDRIGIRIHEGAERPFDQRREIRELWESFRAR